MSPRAWGVIVLLEPFFVFRGLTIGDWRTALVVRVFGKFFLLTFRASMLVLPGAAWPSRFESMGEFVAPVCR